MPLLIGGQTEKVPPHKTGARAALVRAVEVSAAVVTSTAAMADSGELSFWLDGSLAAVPRHPGGRGRRCTSISIAIAGAQGKRAVAIEVALEEIEADQVAGKPIDVEKLARLAGGLAPGKSQ